jgi:hypothetical protein
MAQVAFMAPGLAASTHRCVQAALRRAGHEPAREQADLVVATWFAKPPELPQGTPAVRWWVGSDVLALRAGHTEPHSRDERLNWCGAPWLQQELAADGVAARVMPILPVWEPEPLPLAPEPVVLAYCPQGREQLYRWKALVAVAGRCPPIRFKVFRRDGPPPLPNLICVPGFVDHDTMRAAYAQARAVLRLVEHDGMSLSILEALGFGRHAVWSYPYPACHQAETVDEAARALRLAVAAPLNHAGVAAMRTLRLAADARLALYVQEALE